MIRRENLKFSTLLFLYMLALFVVTLVVSGAITYYVIKDIEIREYRRLLTTNIENAKFYVQGSSNFKQIVKDIKQDSGIRATIMDDKGIVLADSDADVIEIENQLNNEEVKEAFSNKYGEANRYSKTLQHKYLFLAKKVDIGIRSYILRLGVSTESIIRDFVGIWSIITIVFAFSSYIALLITFHLGNKFNAEITKIIKYLVQVINKNYNAKYKPDFTKEFQEIGQKFSKISNMAQSIDEERQNYTDKLQLLNQQQSDILSAVSHEFKNPIAAIMGYSQTLLDDIGIDKKIRRKFLGKITTNALKLTDLIDKLSLSFRFEKGDLKIKPETIDLVEMTNELKNDILQKHRHRGINVITQHPHIEIKADKTFIESVITNLLDNAIKYSEDDVTVSIDNKQIKFIDQGIGIKEEDIEKVTKRFYRASNKTWDNSMGVGLYLVDYILKAHGTKLEIESKLDEGSTFSFKIDGLLTNTHVQDIDEENTELENVEQVEDLEIEEQQQ